MLFHMLSVIGPEADRNITNKESWGWLNSGTILEYYVSFKVKLKYHFLILSNLDLININKLTKICKWSKNWNRKITEANKKYDTQHTEIG